jgi:hypothetical protein
MDSRADNLIKQGDGLFAKKAQLLNLWQEIAENFYPIRADFTTKITPGDDLTQHLSNSYPVMAHRDMSNAFAAMLRQRGTKWFKISTGREELDEIGEDWLEYASNLQFRAMYDRSAHFVRATKEGDADFAAFGQCVIYVDLNKDGSGLLYRNYHLRDCAWTEDSDGKICEIHRKWMPTARQLVEDFGANVHPEVTKCLEAGKNPFQTFECRHIMVPTYKAPDVDKKYERFEYQSFFIDVVNRHVMETAGSNRFRYCIPRWQTISGSQYAYSPATIVALPDARMIQSMSYTLLDAGEKAVQPPMLGQADMIKSDVELWSGGITWVDAEYDERLGEALRPIPLDLRGIPAGVDSMRSAQEMITEAFYLNKISLPPATRDMTAFETSQRVQEYIRQALPLFEPMEDEYNGAICEETFEVLKEGFAFQNFDMPEELGESEISFRFMSPLQEDEDRTLTQKYVETRQLLAEAITTDPDMLHLVDAKQALRDALKGLGAPADWKRSDDELGEILAQQAEAQAPQRAMEELAQGAGAAEQVGNAAAALSESGVLEQEPAL